MDNETNKQGYLVQLRKETLERFSDSKAVKEITDWVCEKALQSWKNGLARAQKRSGTSQGKRTSER